MPDTAHLKGLSHSGSLPTALISTDEHTVVTLMHEAYVGERSENRRAQRRVDACQPARISDRHFAVGLFEEDALDLLNRVVHAWRRSHAVPPLRFPPRLRRGNQGSP